MNNIITFTNSDLGTVRAFSDKDTSWFVGKDVAERLGYSNPTKAIIDHVDVEDKQFVMLDFGAESQNGIVPDSSSGKTKTTLINESGMYSLVLRSRLPAAKKFKRWVTSEVLPSLRRSGTYSLSNQNRILIETNNHLSTIIAKYEKLSARIDDMNIRLDALGNMSNRQVDLLSAILQHDNAPKAVISEEALGVRAMAREFGVKLKPFVTWLIEHDIIRRNKYGNLCPTAKYESCNDLFKISSFKRWNMEEPSISMKVTAKGREVIWNAIQPDINTLK